MLKKLCWIAICLIIGSIVYNPTSHHTPTAGPAVAPITTTPTYDGMTAACIMFLVVGVLFWLKRGGKSPEITRETKPRQMGFRAVTGAIGGLAAMFLLFAVLGAALGHPVSGPNDPVQYEKAKAWVHNALEPTGYWEKTEAEHGVILLFFAPVILVAAALFGWLVTSIFI